MRKLKCRCGAREFCIDEKNAGRITCPSCGKHYFWNGNGFVETSRIERIKQRIARIFGFERKPEPVRPETYGERKLDVKFKELMLREKKEAKERNRKEKKVTVYLRAVPKKRKRRWSKVWRDFILVVVEKEIVKVHDKEHVGSFRGKHILKEAHRRLNSLGYPSRVNFGCGTIEFLGDKRAAMDDLMKIET